MNIIATTIALIACVVLSVQSAVGAQILYLTSSQDKAVIVYSVNGENGELVEKFKTKLPGRPGVMTFSPDAEYVYVTMSAAGKPGIVTLKRHGDGSLSLSGTAALTSDSCYLRTDGSGRFLLASHYSAGDVSIYRIVDGVCTSELTQLRKTAPRAHCVEFDPSGRFVFVPHTSPNKVYQFHFDDGDGTISPNDPPFVDGPDRNHRYHEPRHYVHHPVLDTAYTSGEFGGGITAWKFDPDSGTLKRLETLSTLQPDVSGEFYAADIQVTPDGRFVYVSNRDQTADRPAESRQDTLAAFALDSATGLMTRIGWFPTPNQPNSFCVDQTGRYLYSAGTDTSILFAYHIDQKTGHLDHFATYETGRVPVWVMCGSVDQPPAD